MKLNQNKIKAKLKELESQTNQPWVEVAGVFSFTSVELLEGDVPPNFNPASGLLVKTFVNRVTGEVKSYYLDIFV